MGLTSQNHTGASGLYVSISGKRARWHHKSTVQICLYSVSPAVKMAWGLPIVPSPQVYLKKVMCKGHGSWFCCSGSWCHCSPLACGMNVHHRCQTKVANLCGINQKLMAEALAMIESTQQVCDKLLQLQAFSHCVGQHEVYFWALASPLSSLCPYAPPLWYLLNAFVLYGSL